LSTLLTGLSDDWVLGTEGEDTFSPRDVVAHLITGEETDWVERAEIILRDGTKRPFTPFDRFAFREKYGTQSLAELLERFRELRVGNLERIRGLGIGSSELERQGAHPELGTVRLRELLATWAVHDLGHIRQIVRVMAKQYRDEVGPWRAYLRVLGE
jgi:hypothetical protein